MGPEPDLNQHVMITAEQLAEAPEEVRAWVRRFAGAKPDRAGLMPKRDGCRTSDDGLAICSGAEIKQLLRRLGTDYVACQVLFQFGCAYDHAVIGEHRPRVLAVIDFIRHTDVTNSAELHRCLDLINAALRACRGDPDATIYLPDGHDGLCVHPMTQRMIHRLWQRLVRLAAARETGAQPGGAAEPAPAALAVRSA